MWYIIWNVAVKLGALEGGVAVIRLEVNNFMSAVSLVNQNKCNIVPKGPSEKSIIISFHENERQGEIGVVANSIPMQVGLNAHLITGLRCEELRTSYCSCTLPTL